MSHPSLDKSRVYEVIPQNGCETTVATAGERWSFDPRRRPLARLRLMPSDANISEISSSSFAFSDPGIQVFFGAPPLLCLSVDFQHDDVRLEAEQVLELLDHVELTAGMDAESVPSIRVPCKRLRNDFSVIPSASGVQLRLPLESFLSIELTEPGFNVRRIALDGWLELEEGAGGTLGVSGQSERFVVLPYNLETPLPRSPEIPGGVRLEDTSGLHNPFELREATSNEIPSEGQVVAEAVYLSNRFPFSNLDLLKRTDLTLLGAWFWKDEWDLEALRTFLIDTFTPCARVVIPNVDQKVQIAVNTGESITPRDFLVATILQGPVVGDLNLLKLLPRELFEDTPAQKKWLGSPYSSICLESDGRKVGGISLDLRPCVLGFKMLHQGIPSLAGGTTCQLEVEVICGFVAGESLEIIAIPLAAGEPEQSEERFPVQMNSSGLDRQIHCCSVSVREPGEYRLALRRKGETFAIRSLDITAFSPAIPEGDTPLTDFLESWPSGEPALANATLLYRFLRNLYEPWHEYSLYTLIDRSRDAIRDQKSILYQLIDTLLGYLDDPPRTAARVSLIQPENVPAGILAEVGTVAIQLQFYTEPPLRNRLAAWKATLSQAASDESRTSEERTWLKALADAANRLKTDSGSAASVTHRSNEHFVQPYFPCRADFLRFLQGYEHRTNRPLARETT
ncbi:MAG: hypothetical protein K8U03_00630 [Planctomycetia bacterium]|nr:hypothetical protein [Planctomycetia bacterium]